MANFLLILDPDPVRRDTAAVRARARVAFLPRLQAGWARAADYAAVWAAAPDAPVTHHVSSSPDGTDCLLFGEPHRGDGRRVSASDLALAHAASPAAPSQLDGYYAACTVSRERGVRVEGDVLGVFPLYYWQCSGVLLVATSPELFRSHPLFAAAVDLHGVAGLLLTSGLVGGRTLWRGVRRLAPDRLLLRPPSGPAREVAPDAAPSEPPVNDLADAVAQARALHESFLAAALGTARRPGLLLSGGLDSRILAGLVAAAGRRPECITFGRPGDLDARCATQVARVLDLPQTLCDADAGAYAEFAQASVRWEHLSGGLYAIPLGWNLARTPPSVAMDRLICGLTLDAVIGGPRQVAASQDLHYEQLRVGRLGFAPAQLASLIAEPALLRACEDLREQLVEDYRAGGATDALREWRMNLAHRHRFAVGGCAWRYSLFAWPVLPALDRRLLRLAARLTPGVAQRRQVQTRLLIEGFPRLARLELDRNYLDTVPLLAGAPSRLAPWRRRATRWRRRLQSWLGHDPRFYVRTMEINGAGWRAVRALAESGREAGAALFRAPALAALLPPPGRRVRGIADPIIHSTPRKNALGLLLWLRPQS